MTAITCTIPLPWNGQRERPGLAQLFPTLWEFQTTGIGWFALLMCGTANSWYTDQSFLYREV